MQPKVLLVDDDHDFRHALQQSLELKSYYVESHASVQSAISTLSNNDFTVVISDIKMPGEGGMSCMNKVLDIDPAIPVVLITGHGNISTAVEAMREGAYDFIEKPFVIDRLTNVINRAIEKRRLVLENRGLREKLEGSSLIESSIVGVSESIVALRSQVAALASASVDVLIWGETGSGKEVIARALHYEGDRAGKPFVAINCGAIPKEMMESELFGHEAGAFTGANKKRIGKLEYANGGTVFLDEIESMPMELQIKLLRIIETRNIERLGSNKQVEIDIRFVAATKTDLAVASANKEFRSDLYYRLNVITLKIPPLRERKEDIPALSKHFLKQAQVRYRKDVPDLLDSDLSSFNDHDWPGNVRELRNTIDCIILGVWKGFGEEGQQKSSLIETECCEGDLSEKVAYHEAKLIQEELIKNQGSIKKTYMSLNISRKTLYDKMQKYGIKKP